MTNWPTGARPGVDLTLFSSADQIMDRASGRERDVVVDLPAQSMQRLMRWVRESDVVGLAEEVGIRLTFWFVTDGSYTSARTLEQTLVALDPPFEVVVVENRNFRQDFSLLHPVICLE